MNERQIKHKLTRLYNFKEKIMKDLENNTQEKDKVDAIFDLIELAMSMPYKYLIVIENLEKELGIEFEEKDKGFRSIERYIDKVKLKALEVIEKGLPEG